MVFLVWDFYQVLLNILSCQRVLKKKYEKAHVQRTFELVKCRYLIINGLGPSGDGGSSTTASAGSLNKQAVVIT